MTVTFWFPPIERPDPAVQVVSDVLALIVRPDGVKSNPLGSNTFFIALQFMPVRPVHPKKAALSTRLTVSGIVVLVKLVHKANAKLPMVLKLLSSSMLIPVKFEQPLNV